MRQSLRSLAARFVLAAALLLLVPAFLGQALAQAGSRIAGIEFKGNRTLDSEVLRQSLRTKKGALLDESLLNEDVKTLYDLFASVAVERAQDGDQVTITFVVTENALAVAVDLKGVSELSESDVRAVMDTTRGRPVADFRVENDARKIERLYRMKGFHFVQVRPEIKDAEAGRTVVFNVLEGPKVQVETITFKGNEHVTRDKLLEFMGTQETGFLGLRGADYVEETLVKDRSSLVNVYRREGYLNAKVEIEDVTFSEDKTEAFVTIAVTEGPAFTVGTVSIVGAGSYPGGPDAIRKLLALEPGKRYRTDDVRRSLDAVVAAYRDEGYFSAAVDYDDRPSGSTVDVTLKIDEQSKVRVRTLSILGNEITQDKVIRREISVYPGEVLNQNEVEKSKRRLESLGYFTRVDAQVVGLPEGEDPNLRDVKFEVDDTARTGQIRFAVGASSDLGLLGSVTVTKRNFDWRDVPEHFGDIFSGHAFTGAGQTFQLELAPGTDFSSYRLAFTEPWLFDKPISFGWDLFFSKFTRFDYDVDRKGLDLTLGRRFTYEGRRMDTVLGISGTTRFESVDLSNVQSDSSPTAFLAEGSNGLVSERFSFRVERLDNSMNPTDGWFAQYTPEIGFASDIQLLKNEFETRRYFTLGKTEDERLHTLSVGGRIAHVQPLSGSVEADDNLFDNQFVPTYESYFAGGASSVRGFAYGGAGPHGQGNPFLARQPGESSAERNIRLGNTANSVTENDGDPMGGDVMLLASAEYGFPLYEDVLRGVLFLDSGLVRNSFSSGNGLDRGEFDRLQQQLSRGGKQQKALARQMHYDDGDSFFGDIRASVGFGIRIKIPAFGATPIALDFGFPIKKQDGDDTQVFSFSIARDF